jgi:hypothetical protein
MACALPQVEQVWVRQHRAAMMIEVEDEGPKG